MPQYAAVDIGSNSVRLLVADAAPHEPLPQIIRVVEECQVTRLGESVFRDGSISDEAMQEVAGVLAQMRQTWQKYDVVGARAVATSATRDTSNQAEFIKHGHAKNPKLLGTIILSDNLASLPCRGSMGGM